MSSDGYMPDDCFDCYKCGAPTAYSNDCGCPEWPPRDDKGKFIKYLTKEYHDANRTHD